MFSEAFAHVVTFFRDPWNVVGGFGQALFASRFVIQWVRSEMAGRSIIPIAFWYCSLGGGLILLAYAFYRQEPVFVAGQLPGIIVYSRNLYLIYRERRRNALTVEIETPRR